MGHNHDQLVCLPFESPLSVDVLITTKNWMLRTVNYFNSCTSIELKTVSFVLALPEFLDTVEARSSLSSSCSPLTALPGTLFPGFNQQVFSK
jgi:hypothetical protein